MGIVCQDINCELRYILIYLKEDESISIGCERCFVDYIFASSQVQLLSLSVVMAPACCENA